MWMWSTCPDPVSLDAPPHMCVFCHLGLCGFSVFIYFGLLWKPANMAQAQTQRAKL